MSTHDHKPDHEPDPIFPDRLEADLRSLARVEMIVPRQIEDDLRAQAARHLAPRNRLRIHVRRAMPLAAAAGLAITAFVGFRAIVGGPAGPATGPAGSSPLAQNALDIDASGQINILDAFVIARALETGTALSPMWDVTTDGVVNIRDVDAVAAAAVSLSERSRS